MPRRHHSHSHSKSSRRREEERGMEASIAAIKEDVFDIDEMLSEYPEEVDDYLCTARSAIDALDRMHFFRLSRLPEQVWLLKILQDYAFHDADNGCVRDVADWVQSKWLRLLRDHPDDKDVLTGLGRHWLQRAQPSLATIQDDDSSGSSGGAGAGSHPAQQRLQTSTYVEARGYLQPSVDFYVRAVAAADRANSLGGELLASTAEAYMSLGNVTASPANEQHFARAVRYLRRARDVQGYTLNTFHQQYLDEYGRYVA